MSDELGRVSRALRTALETPGRRRAAGATLAGIALLAVGFLAGRGSAPVRVVEREVLVEAEHRHETETGHEVVAIAAREERNVERTTETTFEPSGRVFVVVRERDTGTSSAEAVRVVETIREVEVEKLVYVEHEREETPTLPQWRATLDLGLARAPDRLPLPGLAGLAPVIATAGAERRVVGPVWAGAWVSSTPGVGVRLSVEF